MKKQVIAAVAALMLGGVAHAQGYVSGSVGQARLNLDCAGATTCDRTDTAYRLLGGWKFTPNLAAELGYYDYGKGKAADAVSSGEVRDTAVSVGVAFMSDLSPSWNLVGRLGLAQVKTKLTGTVFGVGSGSDSDSNITLIGGLGVGYKVTPNLSIDAALDFSKAKYDKNGVSESGNITMFSVGATFSF